MKSTLRVVTLSTLCLAACSSPSTQSGATADTEEGGAPVASRPTRARTPAREYIAWREHIIDDSAIGGVSLAGGDGLAMADLDLDGHADIVSVHESDTEYDGIADGHVRLAFGSASPDTWALATLADIDGDGDLDAIVGGYSGGSRDADGDRTPDESLGRLAWFERAGSAGEPWVRHDISRRKRGMFDKFIPVDLDRDGDVDFAATRGNSVPHDGVFWLEQVRTPQSVPSFTQARPLDSEEMPLPAPPQNRRK